MTENIKKFFNCSICGGDKFKKLYSFGLFSYEQTVSICKNCGVVCLNPRWDENKYGEYYRNQYYGKYQPKIETDKISDDFESSRGIKIFNDLQEFLSTDAKIIEVGCGEGGNLLVFKKNGFNDLTGLEPSFDCCLKLRKYNINCINESLALWNVGISLFEKFDCVILSHMIEHFVEPEKALVTIRKILKYNGILYILCPNLYGFRNPFSQFTTPHTFYFSKPSLQMLLNKCGFILHKYSESSRHEIVFIAKKSEKTSEIVKENIYEYNNTLSYLKRNRLEYGGVIVRVVFKEILKNLIILLIPYNARERTYLNTISLLKRLNILKRSRLTNNSLKV